MAPFPRTAALLLATFAAAAAAAGAFFPALFQNVPRSIPDFGVYYAAAKANHAGENPYDFAVQAAYQREIDPDYPALRANSGPYTLAVVTPFTAFGYQPARVAWFLLELSLLVWSGAALWAIYDGSEKESLYGWLIAVAMYASLQSIILGQLSVFVLAGLVGFVWYDRAGKHFASGLCLGLLLVKPQNELVLLAVLAVWLADARKWRVVIGGLTATGILTAIATGGNSATFTQYFHALTTQPPTGWTPPLAGTVLRMLFGFDRYWLTFVPLLPGLAWGVWYYAKHRANWAWADRLPAVLLASCLASPYGWAYDHVAFLFPILQVAAVLSRRPGNGVLVVLAGTFALSIYYFAMLQNQIDEFHWVWVGPALAAGYAAFRSYRPRPQALPEPAAS